MFAITHPKKLVIRLLALVATLLSLPTAVAHPATARPVVFVAIPPQAWLVAELSGDLFEVKTLLPPGSDPHTFSPSPSLFMALAKSRLYLSSGLPFEREILKRLPPERPGRVDCTAALSKRPMEDDLDHHGHQEPDPHVWLSPELLKELGRCTAETLIRFFPETTPRVDARLPALIDGIDRVSREIARELAPWQGATLLVYHPAYGYFTDSFGLRQLAVERGGRPPTAAALADLAALARTTPLRLLVAQPQRDLRNARAIAQALKVRLVAVDPLGSDPLATMKQLAQAIRSGQ